MFKLLDTGWLAHRFGKRRWVLYFAAGLVLMVIGWAVTELLMIPQRMGPTTAEVAAPIWPFAVSFLIALLLMIYSAWLFYIDGVREDYKERAAHYRTHGW